MRLFAPVVLALAVLSSPAIAGTSGESNIADIFLSAQKEKIGGKARVVVYPSGRVGIFKGGTPRAYQTRGRLTSDRFRSSRSGSSRFSSNRFGSSRFHSDRFRSERRADVRRSNPKFDRGFRKGTRFGSSRSFVGRRSIHRNHGVRIGGSRGAFSRGFRSGVRGSVGSRAIHHRSRGGRR